MSTIFCHWSRSIVSAGAAFAIPAQLTASRSGPSSAWTAATARSICSPSVTSASTARARRPVAAISPAVPARSPPRSRQPTCAPDSASPSAIRRPMPPAAPVTSATRSSRRNDGSAPTPAWYAWARCRGGSDDAGDRPHAGPAGAPDVRAGGALVPEVVADVRHAVGGDVAHRAELDARRLLVDGHLGPRLADGQRRADDEPEERPREQVLGEVGAGAAADAVGVGVEAVEHVQPVHGAAPAPEVVVRVAGVAQHLAGLELQPLEVAIAPVGVGRDDRAVVV